MSTTLALIVVGQHFLFDWKLQPRWVALNKSHNNAALAFHGAIVAFGFFIAAMTVHAPIVAMGTAAIYGVLHMVQDKVIWSTFKTKSTNPKAPYAEKLFWDVVAFDQFVHLAIAFVLINHAPLV